MKNQVTQQFASIGKYINKFHFKNHVGKRCVDKRDPYKIKALDNVNTQACEQLFRDVNKLTNCKAMSESHFFMLWLYYMDLHNLCISGLDRVEPDPREDYRESIVKVNNIDISSLRNCKSLSESEKCLDVIDPNPEKEAANQDVHPESISQEEQLLNKLKSLDISLFTCDICKSKFKNTLLLGDSNTKFQKIVSQKRLWVAEDCILLDLSDPGQTEPIAPPETGQMLDIQKTT